MSQHDLRQAGLKITAPRTKILQILENAKSHHFSAEDIYRLLLESGEEISMATVYRVLTQFEQAGIVVRHHFEGGFSVFELNQGQHHDHLVCVKCGKVVEFVDPIIEKHQEKIARDAGFVISDHVLHIYGICALCQQIQQKL